MMSSFNCLSRLLPVGATASSTRRVATAGALLSGVALLSLPGFTVAPALGQATGGVGYTSSGGAAGQAGGDGVNGTPGGAAGTAESPDGKDAQGSDGAGGGGGYSTVVTTGAVISEAHTGGAGGRGAAYQVDSGGGGAGGGGDGLRVDLADPMAMLTINASITGGIGGASWAFYDNGPYYTGAAGGGGAGIVLMQGAGLIINAAVVGGEGGRSLTGGGFGAGGGGGGAGVVMQNGGDLMVSAAITGGTTRYWNAALAAGGTGGAGVVMTGWGSVVTTATGSIVGGDASGAGTGGAGIEMRAGGTVVNAGVIRGGTSQGFALEYRSGGLFQTGGIGSGGAAGLILDTRLDGVGGAGILGADLTVINSGSITGGIGLYEYNYLQLARVNAIEFTGGINSLELQHGSHIVGNVLAGGASDTLILGGDTDSSFDLSHIVEVGTPEAEDQYVGFELFEKAGASTWVLTGTGDQDWTISGGKLVVDGSIGGVVRVTDGILGGSGTVGATTVASGAILAPGNSIGTLHFADGLSFDAGSFYLVEVKEGGNIAGEHNDLAEVSGLVNIDATAQVRVRAENGTDDGSTYAPDTTYTIITATDGINGRFDGVVDNDLFFLDASLDYDLNAVYLTLTRNERSFASAGTTANQQAAASGLAEFGFTDPIYRQIVGMSAEGAQRAFDLASGEVHASGQLLTDNSFDLFAGSLRQKHGAETATGKGAAAQLGYAPEVGATFASLVAVDAALAVPPPVHSVWLAPLAGRGTVLTDGNGAELEWQSGGLTGGYDVTTSLNGGEGRFGLGLGYLVGDVAIPDRLSSLASEGGYGGIYGSWTDGAWSLGGTLAYGASHVTSSRDIIIGTISETAAAEYWTHTAGVSLEAAYGFQLSEGFTVGPVGTLDVAWSGHGAAEETGAGTLNALIDPASAWRIESGVGLDLTYGFALGDGGSLTLKGRALWEHGFGATRPEQTLALAGGGGPFTVAGPETDRDRLKLGAGISWSPTPAAHFSLDYAGTFSSNQTDHGGQASIKVGF